MGDPLPGMPKLVTTAAIFHSCTTPRHGFERSSPGIPVLEEVTSLFLEGKIVTKASQTIIY